MDWIISTHTSRVGCDLSLCYIMCSGYIAFLLTHPVWDVTMFRKRERHSPEISTHTSRVGCDADTGTYRLCADISTHTSRVGCDSYI